MPDLEISNLPTISGSLLQAADPLAMADLSASETKQVTVKDLLQGGIALIDDSSIPAAKINYTLPPNSVGTTEIADNSITALKLADESTAVVELALPTTGAYVGQLGYNESTGKLYIWDGTVWQPFKAAGSVNTITYDNTLGPFSISGTVTGDNVELGVIPQSTSSGGMFLAGPGSTGGVVDYRQILGTDLPRASTDKGAVAVNGNGLAMVGDAISIDNSVDPSGATYGVVTYDAYGLVQDGRAISAADLPIASLSDIGAIRPGPSFGISGTGELSLSNVIAPGTATKVTYDGTGLITAATNLTEVDIPPLDASKITSGTFGSGLLAANSVTATQLADYGIAKISSSQPTPEFAGQLWVNPTDRTAYVWVGQVAPAEGYYLPLNNEFGAQANLRFGGTYNASTNTVASLNSYGAEAGLTVASPLIAPTAASSGIYLLVTTTGTGISPAPAVSLDVGDWILSPGVGTTWTHINLVGAGITVIDSTDVTFDGSALTPVMSGVADASAAITTLWGRSQIATLAAVGIVLESTEVTVDNSTGAMAVGVVDEGSY